MSQLSPIRIFFAIDPPPVVKEQIQQLLALLRVRYTDSAIRWTNLDNLHITLQFLASVNMVDLPEISHNVREEISNTSSFEIELTELEPFPSHHHPRIISLKITPNDTLSQLSAAIGRGVAIAGYDIETRPFRAHLTLARLHHEEKNLRLDTISFSPLKITVKEVLLYQSKPHSGGSNYTVLERFDLRI